MTMTKKSIACIGAGPIGSSWAIVFARAEHSVLLCDIEKRVFDESLKYIERSLADLHQEGLVTDERKIRSRIKTTTNLTEAVHDASFVIESVTEDVETKRQLFSKLDRTTSREAIVTSSSSSIPGSEFMAHVKMRERCLIAHPVNPPHLIPVVEFCVTPWTAHWAFEACWELMKYAGQRPIRVNKEIPAFVVNRLQAALIGEAMHLVDEEVVSVEDLDISLKHGFGRRLAFTGPFESMHLNSSLSFKDYLERYKDLLRNMIEKTRVKHAWSKGLLEKIAEERDGILPLEKIADRKAWRDRQLMKILKIWEVAEKDQS